jgi:hypothetical protein
VLLVVAEVGVAGLDGRRVARVDLGGRVARDARVADAEVREVKVDLGAGVECVRARGWS